VKTSRPQKLKKKRKNWAALAVRWHLAGSDWQDGEEEREKVKDGNVLLFWQRSLEGKLPIHVSLNLSLSIGSQNYQ